MQKVVLILGIDTYANHKDMSEFCKRKVSPSMLFGSSLDDSHLNVIYYSKLNVPYSCMVTIRTEPPYVIVLVIDVVSEVDLREVCATNREPMAVYHVVPAYGGYWGSLPEHLMTRRKTNHTRAYTIKTTTQTATSSVQEEEEENNTEIYDTEKIPTWADDFVVTKEIPLMNISGNFQLVDRPIQHVQDLLDDDDVTPKKGEDYVTSLVPLVKFSPNTQTGRLMHFNTSDGDPFFQLVNYNTRQDSITMDPRLLFTTERTKVLTKKSKWVANRWKHFKKNKYNNLMRSTSKLVNRESWENIVKVAPALASWLSSTQLPDRHHGAHLPKNYGKRSKKSFRPINIELAEPRHLDASIVDYVDNIQLNSIFMMMNYNMRMLDNFEMTDDDMVTGRKLMQNLTSNKGELIVNICDLRHQGKTEWVKVLNTSGIIVAVNNFTLDHLRLIVTPGLPLFKPEEQCLGEQTECRINDTRVCISRTLACDSVPNCGSNSTNDEDRVHCGLRSGRGAMSVLAAALACLVLVVAAAYTLYHWVTRCVPNVAQAFFVYTDQSENTLLLHTVMRSPNDIDVEPDPSLSGQFSFVDLTSPDLENIKDENVCKRLLRNWWCCMYSCNKIKKVSDKTIRNSKVIEQIELTEKELKKIMPQKDEIIQTESSLEMKNIIFYDTVDEGHNDNVKASKESDFMKYVNERAKTLRRSLGSENNLASISPEVLQSITEEELENTVYERKDKLPEQKRQPKTNKRTKPAEINPIESIEKHLRFLENPTLIPDLPDQSDSQDIDYYNRPSVSGINSRGPSNIEAKGSKEFSRNYWKLPIGKKSKKPPKK
ncbi:uncharacterized protein LOC121729545 [Aricia agestis]|uniref:uncharacterized protein LOC121729545 n=1 Tax=Aricia agestis TaxID=91739 RepID=UPI001C20AC3A|nr:uncharacterized protein LOC121729545 [Aricia agestis]